MSGYIRQDVTDQIANGNVVDAIPLDQEFDAITSAFAGVGGHRHDGSVGEGAPITVVGPVQDLIITGSSVSPKTDNTLDLGAVGKEFKNLYITGTANIDALVADTADINGGTVDATSVGATTPSTGAFTTLSSSGAATLAFATVGGQAVTTAFNTQSFTNKTINLNTNTLVATSAQLAASVTDETGTGALVFASSPTFTGVPLAPTPATNTNTTQVATTAYVVAQIADDAPTKTGGGATGSWTINADTATALETPRTINGTLFSGTANITTANWGTSRTFTLGSTGKAVNGSANLSWTLAEIGAQATNTKLTGLTGMGATAGIVVQTALDTFDTRTIGVAANTGVTIANGDGVATNPTISGVTQLQAAWDAGVSTTESVISPDKLSSTIIAQKITQSASQSTAAGTAFDFTAIPATVKRVTLVFTNISLSGTDNYMVQLGTSGGFVVTGYAGGSFVSTGGGGGYAASTSGFLVGTNSAAELMSGHFVLTRSAVGSNSWVASHVTGTSARVATGGGAINLGAALTQVRLTRDGANTFDNGAVSIMWE